MTLSRITRRSAFAVAALVVAAGSLVAGRRLRASDHQDTPEVELNSRLDVNDVFAFPNAAGDRITLAMTVASPITPAASATTFFDPNVLYQIKIDTSTVADGVEDLVFQVTFTGTDASQQVKVVGPIPPPMIGVQSRLATSGSSVTGAINTTLGSSTGTQVFAGLRADPFFIDLSQFFKILPDRRPATGPLSAAQTPVATWRPLCAADGSNAATCAKDFLNGINALAIVIELPVSQVKSGGKFGVWGTTSR